VPWLRVVGAGTLIALLLVTRTPLWAADRAARHPIVSKAARYDHARTCKRCRPR
jgi:hypothetical protein